MPVDTPLPDAGTETKERPNLSSAFEKGWSVIVWNDPVNLMSYVVHVFRSVLGFDLPTATRHMLEVHHKGKSCVARETREKAELTTLRLQQYGLKASFERAG